jgi:rubrerythrin
MFEQAFKNIDDMYMRSLEEILTYAIALEQETEEFFGAITGVTR